MKLSINALFLFAALASGSFAAGCASTPKARTEAVPPRLKDSAPERVAAQRTANPQLSQEAEDERWGISAAQARELDQKSRTPPAGANASGTGRVDVTPPAPAK